ncbi:ABC transporter ATP-binding protein [Desertimonas flava]|uniref:ABC transporter ATP-binding protein n=1 Tax=Desertimonas flava TaxID=2064846 RepID=UPI000E3449F9|nr:ABC transporter ATP-binding protein [Desertimonas flava]
MIGSVSDAVLTVDDLVVHHRSPRRRDASPPAVDGVSLHVSPDEIVGLVGESGSGKSTIALSVCGLGPVSSGTVRAGGHDFSMLRGAERRRAHADVQMVFQDPHGSLDPRQSVAGGFAELRRVNRWRDVIAADGELLEMVGLGPEVLRRLPHQLSGGQAQRVSIARALLLRPKLLVADEPTSGLDVSVQAHVLALFERLRTSEHLAVLFISHDLAVVRRLCDRAYVLHRGRVVEHGHPAEMFERPRDPYTRRLVEAVPGATTRFTMVEAGPMEQGRA